MLHLVRHARTAANAAGLLQGRIDPPLDAVGEAQLAGLAALVPRADRLICSPALRARQTAAVFGLDAEIDDRWQEIDYGTCEGTAIADLGRDVWRRWTEDDDFAPGGGETIRDLAVRVYQACLDLADDARAGEVVVVAHATPVKVAMAWALGCAPSIVWRSHVDHASVTRIAMRDLGPALTSFNER